MTVAFLIALACKSVATAGLTLLALQLTKRRSAGQRSWIAHIGLLATLLLPLSLTTGPEWRIEALPSFTPPLAVEAPAETSITPTAELSAVAAPSAPAPASTSDLRLGMSQIAPWLYAVPAGVLTSLLLIALLRLHRLRRRADVLVEPQWLTALARAQRRMGFKHATALLVSEDLRSPISWGLVRPIILLDARAATDAAQAEAVIAHELAHVARLDWAMLILGRLATAVFWFNPLVWILARRCHELSEQAVDDDVLRSDIRSTDYAQVLLGAARHSNGGVLLAANGVAGSGPLTHRVERVLDTSHSRTPARWTWVFSCSAVALFTAGPLFALTPRAPVPSVSRSDSVADAVVLAAAEQARFPTPAPSAPAASDGAIGAAGLSPVSSSPQERDALVAAPELVEAPASSADGGAKTDRTDAPSSVRMSELSREDRVRLGNDLRSLQELGKDLQSLKGLEALSSLQAVSSTSVQLSEQTRPKTAAIAGSSGGAGRAVRNGREKPSGLSDVRPLLTAVWYGRLEMVKYLLDEGADINGFIPGEGTPLNKAAARGNMEMIKLLLDRGANINAVTPGGGTALGQASYHGHEVLARHLIARGADVNLGSDGETPLSLAVAGNNPSIVRLLIAAGAGRRS